MTDPTRCTFDKSAAEMVVPWEKAAAYNGFPPKMLDDLPNIHVTLFTDYLEGLADAKFGAGRWVKRDDIRLEEMEPLTRDCECEETDDDGDPVLDESGNPVMVQYHDDQRYFRMTAWFRAKGQGE